MKNIAVLGSTGSIGTQTLDVVRANPERLCVKALAAGHNITQLESQIREFHPQIAAVWDEEKAKELRIRIVLILDRACLYRNQRSVVLECLWQARAIEYSEVWLW